MKNGFLLFIYILFLGFLVSWKSQINEDELALKISKSANFKEYADASLNVIKDIIKIKKDTALNTKFKNLDSVQKRDSIAKILVRSDSYMNDVFKTTELRKKLIKEFPELNKITLEGVKRVYKKAMELYKPKISDYLHDSLNTQH